MFVDGICLHVCTPVFVSACKLDLGADRFWKAPSMLLAIDQKCYRGTRRERGQLAAASPAFWKQDLSLTPSQAPCFVPMLSSRPSIQGPGLAVSGDENAQSSASPARPVKDLVLCIPPASCAHSSYPHLNSALFPLLSCLCSGHRNHFCSPFCDRPGLCHGSLSLGGARGFGWLAKSREA